MKDWFDMYFAWFFVFGFPVVCFIIAMMTGCGVPDFDGPYCDTVDALDWSPAYLGESMDVNPMWSVDPDLEAYLWGFTGGEGGFPEGNDFDEDGVALSPKAKHLTALEFIVTVFPDWEDFDPTAPRNELESNPLKWFAAMVWQMTPPTRFDCGNPGTKSATYFHRPKGDVIVYYPGYMNGSKTGRAAIIVHENWHSTGAKHAPSDSARDQRYQDAGSYYMGALYLAAVCYAPDGYNITSLERNQACRNADWILKNKFVEPSGLTITTFDEVWTDFRRYL